MFLQLSHQKLYIHNYSINLIVECYAISALFPEKEKFGLTSQLRRAAVSTHLNLCEGISRKSVKEKYRYLEISRSSLVEVDAGFDIAFHLNYLQQINLEKIRE